jgi:hypothetical protein
MFDTTTKLRIKMSINSPRETWKQLKELREYVKKTLQKKWEDQQEKCEVKLDVMKKTLGMVLELYLERQILPVNRLSRLLEAGFDGAFPPHCVPQPRDSYGHFEPGPLLV